MTEEQILATGKKLIACILEQGTSENLENYESEMEHGDCSDWSNNFRILYSFLLVLLEIIEEGERKSIKDD